jgi:CHASE2 domain-containing sensor protein
MLLLVEPLGRGLVNLSYDLPYALRPKIPAEEVTLVYLDVESHARLGQTSQQNWNRAIHARLIDKLTALGARTIAFDIVFLARTNLTDEDRALVNAAKRSGRVVTAAKDATGVVDGEPGLLRRAQPPFPELEEVVSWGIVAVATGDSVIRQNHFLKDLDAPSFAWRTAKMAFPGLTAAPYERRWLNYYGPPGYLPHYSYADVLNNQVDHGAFSNRVVLVGSNFDIGPSGAKPTDYFPTPYSLWTGTQAPGVEVNATAVLNLLRGEWLKRTSTASEIGWILLAGLGLGGGFSLLRPFVAVGAAALCCLLIGTAACYSVWAHGIWFPWMIICVAQIPLATAWSVLAHTRRLSGEKAALEEALSRAESRDAMVSAADMLASARLTPAQSAGNSAIEFPPVQQARDVPVAGIDIPDYTLVRQIGKGAYGEVWLARTIIGTHHAAKIVHRDRFAEAAPFEREFNGLRRFAPISRAHPGFVQVLHIGRTVKPECIYYLMELGDDEVRGQDINPADYQPRNLAKELKKHQRVPLPELVRLALQVSDAVAYLHERGLIHRDIKPSNIIFVNGHAKLADIGLVTEMAVEGRDVSCIGTMGYMPPEGPGTPGADVYSLGKVLYQAATGMAVSRFPELPSVVMQGDRDPLFQKLNQIINQACLPDPKARYRTARELHGALSALCAS